MLKTAFLQKMSTISKPLDSSLLWQERACEMSWQAVFYIVAYNTFTIITKFKRF